LSVNGNAYIINGSLGFNRNPADGSLPAGGNAAGGRYQLSSMADRFQIESYNSSGANTGVMAIIANTGNVGIGNPAPAANLRLDVEGRVGASEYCDQDGGNCKAVTAMGGCPVGYNHVQFSPVTSVCTQDHAEISATAANTGYARIVGGVVQTRATCCVGDENFEGKCDYSCDTGWVNGRTTSCTAWEHVDGCGCTCTVQATEDGMNITSTWSDTKASGCICTNDPTGARAPFGNSAWW
jgi:hypothetical protein